MKNKKLFILLFILTVLILCLILLLPKKDNTPKSEVSYYSKYLENEKAKEDSLITSFEDYMKLSLGFKDITEEFFKDKILFAHYEEFDICEEDINKYVEITRCDAIKKIGFFISDVCEKKCTSTVVYLFPYSKDFITKSDEIKIEHTELYKVCER